MDLSQYVERIEARRKGVRRFFSTPKQAAYCVAAQVSSAPRRAIRAWTGRDQATPDHALQLPWLPIWPSVRTQPIYDSSTIPWTQLLIDAFDDVLEELTSVRDRFERARYDSKYSKKPWQTFYFFLQGRAITENLRFCPRTARLLEQIPHNRLHVCFSALPAGGMLEPHTGPMNTSLTAHLGLADCTGSRLWVGSQSAPYVDREVVVFDDSFVHWARNDGPKTRYTLMVTFWHPDLTVIEKGILRLIVREAARMGA